MCAASLKPSQPLTPLSYDFDAIGTKFIPAGEALFINANPFRCSIQNCTLFDKSCSTELAKDSPVKLSPDEKTVIISRNVKEGYKLEICAKCSNAL